MSSGSSQQWTEPPWSGWIETTGDALLILEAARRGLIPRVTRRLVDAERKMICSGSVFVFDEDESGIKRWTDGYYWSPSRILGNFLLYRETDKRSAGHRGSRAERNSTDSGDDTTPQQPQSSQVLSRPKADSQSLPIDKQRERTLMGSLTNNYKFKQDGLMKKTFSLTIGGVAQHLISYYKIEDVEKGRLRSPSSLPELASLDISPEYLDKTHFRNPPKVELGADGILRYRGEADDIDAPASSLSGPLSSALPLLTPARLLENPKRQQKRTHDSAAPPQKRHKSSKDVDVEDPSSSPVTYPEASSSTSNSSSSMVVTAQPTATHIPTTAAYAPYPMHAIYPGYPLPPHMYAMNSYAQAQQGPWAYPPMHHPPPTDPSTQQAVAHPGYYHPYPYPPPPGYPNAWSAAYAYAAAVQQQPQAQNPSAPVSDHQTPTPPAAPSQTSQDTIAEGETGEENG